MEQNIPHQLIVRSKAGVQLCNMLSDEVMPLLTADDNCSIIPTTDHLLIAEKKRILVHDYTKPIAE